MAVPLNLVVRTVPEQTCIPLHTFPVQEVFVWRHEQGTLIEQSNEETALKRLNDRRLPFKAWPIAPIPGLKTSFAKSWLLLVKPPPSADDFGFPCLTDRFTIDMESKIQLPDGDFSLVHLPATRIPSPYSSVHELNGAFIQRCAAFKVDVPRSWKNKDGEHVELDLMARFQTANAIDDISGIKLDEGTRQIITIRWDTSSATFDAELAALRLFTDEKRTETRGPSFKAQKAFKMLQNFHETWKNFYNLHDEFPHLKKPAHPFNKVPKLLVDMFEQFNADHRAAYEGLTRIPNGLYFVNGCPGSGKTHWNLTLSALIHCKRPLRTKRRNSSILFLVDINKTVDDAADRYFSLCKAAGLNVRIVRMHGWPYEMRNSTRLNKGEPSEEAGDSGQLDFTKKFLITANLARYTTLDRDRNKAPTLDEAAWDYYELHQDDCFSQLKKLLERMDAGEAFSTADWKSMRSRVGILYRVVLAQTDFVATTPVAASGAFSRLFRPVVVFVDEAPHARELTTLIPIALFDPIAWIFTGDVNQTRPFVKSENKHDAKREGLKHNPFSEQLRVSTMERADKVGALNSKLLVNQRAHGNLHRLPSTLFYSGEMVSGYEEEAQFPPTTLHLKEYLEKLGGVQSIDENRVIIRLQESMEENSRKSFWNPAHHGWLVQQVQVLLRDTEFRMITDLSQPGTIIIATPYSSAVRQYHAEVKKWPKEWQDRVQVLTVDKAQGNQADVVFCDMVRTTSVGFMDDPRRLNVAISRARQAEIILMHVGMTMRPWRGQKVRTTYMSRIWDDASVGQRVFTL